MNETKLSRQIQSALERLGALVERTQSGAAMGLSGGRMRLAKKGTPDLFVAWRGAQGFLEVKTDTGELSDDQIAWHEKARREGVRVEVVRSVEQALRVVQAWRGAA